MKTIEVFNTVILLDLFEDEKFISLNRYLTDKKASYFIKSLSFSKFDIPFYEPTLRTEFYDLYEMDNLLHHFLNSFLYFQLYCYLIFFHNQLYLNHYQYYLFLYSLMFR